MIKGAFSGLITRRSPVRIWTPLPIKSRGWMASSNPLKLLPRTIPRTDYFSSIASGSEKCFESGERRRKKRRIEAVLGLGAIFLGGGLPNHPDVGPLQPPAHGPAGRPHGRERGNSHGPKKAHRVFPGPATEDAAGKLAGTVSKDSVIPVEAGIQAFL